MRGSSHFLCYCKESNQRKQRDRLSVHHEPFLGVVRKLTRPSHHKTEWSRSSIPAGTKCLPERHNRKNQTNRRFQICPASERSKDGTDRRCANTNNCELAESACAPIRGVIRGG